MTKSLTSRFWHCTFAVSLTLFLAVMLDDRSLVALGVPFLWMLTLSVVDGWWPGVELRSMHLSSERVVEGDELQVVVQLDAQTDVPWIEIELQTPAGLVPVDSARLVRRLRAGETGTYTFTLCASMWGVTGPDWVTVATRDRFGITEAVSQHAIGHRVRVHPTTERLASMIPVERTRRVSGDHRSTDRGSGTELAEVREYQSGDPIRSVHARLSARRGRPVVLQRHPDQSADIVLFVDSVQDVGTSLESSLRCTVTAATAISRRHMRSMDRVGILDRGAGVRWLAPGLGRRALHVIVDSLLLTSVLRPRSQDLHAVPLAQIPGGATVVCVSPLLSAVVRQDLVLLRRQGHRVVVLRPEMPGVDHSASDMADRIFRVTCETTRYELARDGVVVLDWKSTESMEPLLQSLNQQIHRFATSAGVS